MIEEGRCRHLRRVRHFAAGLGLAALLAGAGQAAAEPSVSEVRISRHEGLTRISIGLSEAVQFRAHVLGAPYRVIVDLPPVDWRLGTEARLDSPPVTAWRYGSFGKDVRRIVFDVDRPVRIQKTFALPPKDKAQEWRLVIDLERISKDEFDRILREQRGTLPDYTAPGDEARAGQRARRDSPLVVIDPGHGGIDPGATGKNGTSEKDIVLLVAKELRDRIWNSGKYRVLMTRGADYYIALRQRFEIARSAGADIFISLHADSSPVRASRGLSVYTLSAQASDEEAAALARRENRADLVAGVDISRNDTRVAGILIDLAQRQSLHNAHRLAGAIVAALEGRVELVPKPLRSAGFAVLKAPDVASVLIEMGHLSNPKEEHQLRDPAYRAKLAEGLMKGIDRYFAAKGKGAPARRGAEADAER
ncbi:MAG: N-acetylmuramoyl-L-alanine amidase [Alphaproteobacteria bacterium]